ncbi:hypothetical protein [Streptacidiphilus neutrinimicus]|uniref:hypothetical protein n=1 Tax=Streptacidiphilus neutrinimicus TaxID=105420 RepID=UPI001269D105|nr:hypothetical protein [Streptacidiphilus neutrinimicus]
MLAWLALRAHHAVSADALMSSSGWTGSRRTRAGEREPAILNYVGRLPRNLLDAAERVQTTAEPGGDRSPYTIPAAPTMPTTSRRFPTVAPPSVVPICSVAFRPVRPAAGRTLGGGANADLSPRCRGW